MRKRMYEKPLAQSVACINASSWGHQGKLKRQDLKSSLERLGGLEGVMCLGEGMIKCPF